MEKVYKLKDIRKASIKAKGELFLTGNFPIKKKIRKKPRDIKEQGVMFKMALSAFKKYQPYWDGNILMMPFYFKKK